MKRKGWTGIEEESIPSFLQIHNSVNERSWKMVREWEEGSHWNSSTSNDNESSPPPSSSLELKRFEGRPKDLSPKAWFWSTLGGCEKPFDRHDWYVVHKIDNNGNGNETTTTTTTTAEKRYVLDFYMNHDGDAANHHGMMPRVEIDVRPALDSPEAVFQRGKRILEESFPGIAREFRERFS